MKLSSTILRGHVDAAIRASLIVVGCLAAFAVNAAPFFFSTGNPDGLIATGSRPSSPGKLEIESADDFILSQNTSIDHASFIGLLPTGVSLSSIAQVRVEIYRVFPKDSNNPPSGNVFTRVNSPSDVALDERDSSLANLSFTAAVLNSSFTAANSVLNGINKFPNQRTGGEGAVTGQEVEFDVNLLTPFILGADHYFFIPQVRLTNGDFFWLSAPRPIVAPGTPLALDLQSWIRNSELDPDWSRIGGDIIGTNGVGPAFNAAFTLNGQLIPEPEVLALFALGAVAALAVRRRRVRLT